MQTIRPNSALNYQSLDLPFHFCCQPIPDREFKYKHSIKSNNIKFEIEVGNVVHLRYDWWRIALEGKKTDGLFEGSLETKNKKLRKNFLFPLYKTKEKYLYF